MKSNHINYLTNLKTEYMSKQLIRIIESDRYDRDEIGFKDDFNHGYIQKYIVIDGVEKNQYIDAKIKTHIIHWGKRCRVLCFKIKTIINVCI